MKRPARGPGDTQSTQSGTHLGGRPRGEGDSQHPSWVEGADANPVGDAPRDGPGLARARAGHDHDWAVHGTDNLLLLEVKVAKELVLGPRPTHAPILTHRGAKPAPGRNADGLAVVV